MNLTQKYLPFLCLCYQSPCALLLTDGICDRDITVVCILPRIYIFQELQTKYSLPDLQWKALRKTCEKEFKSSVEEPRKTGFQYGNKLFNFIRCADDQVVVSKVVLGHLQRPFTTHPPTVSQPASQSINQPMMSQ